MKPLVPGLMILALVAGGCRRPKQASSPGPEVQPVAVEPSATPTPSATALALMHPKLSDEDFQAAIAALQAADVASDVATAVTNGDHRLFGIQGAVLEAPGVEGDRRMLPKGAYVVGVAGTGAEAGSKYQQRFQLLARAYVTKYNPLLLSRLK